MAYSFVTVTKFEQGSGTSFSGIVTSSAANALFGTIGTGGGVSPTFSGGGTWTSDSTGSNGTSMSGNISSCPSATGGAQTITVSNVTGGGVASVYEFSGNPSSSIRDAASPAAATGNSAAATTGSLSNVTADAVFIGMMAYNSAANPATVTGTSAGWTYPAGGKETNASSFDAFGSGYNIVAATGAKTSAWTIDSNPWVALIAVYKAAAGAAAKVPYNPGLPQPILAA